MDFFHACTGHGNLGVTGPGKHLHNELERSSIVNGDSSTISTGPFSIAMLNYQRVLDMILYIKIRILGWKMEYVPEKHGKVMGENTLVPPWNSFIHLSLILPLKHPFREIYGGFPIAIAMFDFRRVYAVLYPLFFKIRMISNGLRRSFQHSSHWIVGENLQGFPWFLPIEIWGFPVKIFPNKPIH